MSLDWSEIQKDSFEEKYFKKVDSLDYFSELIGMVRDVFLVKKAPQQSCYLNISFHFETSLIYIYICDNSDCQEDLGTQVILQLLPFIKHFDDIKTKYDTDTLFNEVATKELIIKYKSLFDHQAISQLAEIGLEIKFFNYGWDCETGTVTYKEN